jgi:hypothetical protein
MLSLNYSFVWCTCLNYLNLNWGWIWFEFPRENKKNISKFRKKENSILAQPTQSGSPRPRPLRLTGGSHLSAPSRTRTLSLPPSARWGRPVGANSPRTRVPLSLFLEPRPSAPRIVHPHPPFLSRCAVGQPCQLCLPRTAADPCPRARREDRSRRPPMRPSSFLSPARTRSLFPTSFHPCSLSLALYCRRQSLPEIRIRRADRPSRLDPRQAFPRTVPRWGTRSRARFLLIPPCLS